MFKSEDFEIVLKYFDCFSYIAHNFSEEIDKNLDAKYETKFKYNLELSDIELKCPMLCEKIPQEFYDILKNKNSCRVLKEFLSDYCYRRGIKFLATTHSETSLYFEYILYRSDLVKAMEFENKKLKEALVTLIANVRQEKYWNPWIIDVPYSVHEASTYLRRLTSCSDEYDDFVIEVQEIGVEHTRVCISRQKPDK